jgi:probable rRNA maturation factor
MTSRPRGARSARGARSGPGSRRPAAAAPTIDIIVGSPRWKAQRGCKAILLRAVCAAAAMAATRRGELAIVLTDDSTIRALNREWRGKDAPTNVLSFPAAGGRAAAAQVGKSRGAPPLLGDIVIAYQTTAREARAGKLPFRHHLAHLAVHGFLHLMGHDHETDTEAEAMEALEIAVLARLDIPDPYVMRDGKP